ncbi:MAG TPA: YfiR family protein [Thermoanaerobaculia bacterium]|jgi:hypothetical protein|nr:YfiR family protein [Thermoanaerobaculia bacterium]
MAVLGRRLASAGLFLLLALGVRMETAAEPLVSGEPAVKAAFLYNFAKFVEWPAGAFAGPREPVAFCVVGESAIGDELAQAVGGKTIQGRPVTVERAAPLDALLRCQILFVASAERTRFDQILAVVGRRPVLTVGDDENFRQAGGIINFVLRRNRVRFQIDRAAAERAGLRISSRLLELAEVVDPAGGPAGRR